VKYSKLHKKAIAHAVVASLAFLFFFPVGAILIRLLSFPGLVWFHSIFQLIGQIIFTVAFALGIELAEEFHYVSVSSVALVKAGLTTHR
jgi:hypothetical protein